MGRVTGLSEIKAFQREKNNSLGKEYVKSHIIQKIYNGMKSGIVRKSENWRRAGQTTELLPCPKNR